jgi:polysaccharide pyruvyl transferase WcaK-like protein
LGWYGHHNVGDDSYQVTLPALFPQHEFVFTDSISSTSGFDAILLGGGNVMKEYFLSQLRGVKIPVYAMSVGVEQEYSNGVHFRHVWGREKYTVSALASAGIPTSLMPDLAFTLPWDVSAGRQWLSRRFKAEGHDLYQKVVVVVLNGYLVAGSAGCVANQAMHFLDFSYRMSRVVDETMASFVFLPFGTTASSDDRVANSWVASKCKFWKKNLMVYDRLGVSEAMNVIAAADCVVSSRLHSSVFAFSSGVPLVDLTHHSKNSNFLELVGRTQDSVSYWDFDGRLARDKINDAFTLSRHSDAEPLRKQIKEQVDAIRFTQP